MATKKPTKPKKRRQPRLTAKQKALALLMPEVIDGKLTLKAAMLKAGYAESSSNQQTEAVGSLRNNGVMQEALRKAKITEEKLAEKIAEGLDATKMHGVGGMVMDMKTKQVGHTEMEVPDYATRHKYVVTAAELLDTFPSKKIDATVSTLTYADLDDGPKAETPYEARALAESSQRTKR